MNLQTLDVALLKPAPYNPRKPLRPGMPAFAKLERSLAEFDLVQPIVWNRATGHVVAGHQRLEVLKHRGATTVECIVVELSLEREQALNVALNNEQLASTWDDAKLSDLLSELQALPDFDITLTGFDETDVRDLLLQPDPTRDDAGDDEPEAALVRVALEIAPDDWEDVRPDLDRLLATHREVQAHVRLPS
jgi:ParB-like chromosome segregation protein Spo0J